MAASSKRTIFGWDVSPTVLYTVGLTAAVLLIVGLAVAGINTVLGSTSGRTVRGAGPGGEVALAPNRTLLVTHVHQDELVGVTLVALSGSGTGGTVIFIPRATLGPRGTSLEDTYAQDGTSAVSAAVTELLAVDVHETVQYSNGSWTEVLQPAGAVVVDFPDAVTVTDATGAGFQFGPGPTSVPPALFGPLLASRTQGQSDLARLVLHQQLWAAMVEGFSSTEPTEAGPDDVAGAEGNAVRVLRSLAAGPTEFTTLPVADDASGGFVVIPDEVAALVARAMPGSVNYVQTARLVDGSGDPEVVAAAVAALVENQFRVTTLVDGDGSDLDDPLERGEGLVIYYEDTRQAAAQSVATALGIDRVAKSESPGVVDITLVLGDGFRTLSTLGQPDASPNPPDGSEG